MVEYYDIQEVAGKLRKTEEEVQELVKQGRLRQYMDSGKTVFRTDDVEALAEEVVGLDISSVGMVTDDSEALIELEETSEIQLSPDEEEEAPAGDDDLELNLEPDIPGQKESEGGFGLSQMGDLTMADTNVGTVGINILSGTGDAYKLTDDTRAETSADEIEDLDSLDGDSNLESFGSGSGLLDLSLQADDTSLGAVLDDILPAGTDEGAGAADFGVSNVGLMEEGEDLLASEEAGTPAGSAAAAPIEAPMAAMPVPVAAAAVVDSGTNVFGVLMFFPMLALLLAAIALMAASQNIMPSLLQPLIEMDVAGMSMIWVVIGGLIVLLLLVLMIGSMAGGGGGKVKGAKKPKKAKPAKKKRK